MFLSQRKNMSAHKIESSMRKPKILALHGDVIYGFSQGTYIANRVNNLQNDPVLFDELKNMGLRKLSILKSMVTSSYESKK